MVALDGLLSERCSVEVVSKAFKCGSAIIELGAHVELGVALPERLLPELWLRDEAHRGLHY